MNRPDAWYTPPNITNLSPALNSGSERTKAELNRWVDQQVDVFTRYVITYNKIRCQCDESNV